MEMIQYVLLVQACIVVGWNYIDNYILETSKFIHKSMALHIKSRNSTLNEATVDFFEVSSNSLFINQSTRHAADLS